MKGNYFIMETQLTISTNVIQIKLVAINFKIPFMTRIENCFKEC